MTYQISAKDRPQTTVSMVIIRPLSVAVQRATASGNTVPGLLMDLGTRVRTEIHW